MAAFEILRSSFQTSLYSLFLRPTNNYAVLDGIRAISILWVVLRHSIFVGNSGHLEPANMFLMYENVGLFYSFWLNGFYGVDCFFVLSGFLISNIIFTEIDNTGTLNLRLFYIRRILRLSPALIVVALFVYIIKLPNYEYLWYNIFYINNFMPLEKSVIAYTWSLSIEEQFYIAFSIFMLSLRKSKYIFISIIGLIVAAIIIRFILVLYLWDSVNVPLYDLNSHDSEISDNYVEMIYFKPYTRYGAFLFGVLAMYVHRYHHVWLSEIANTAVIKATVYGAVAVILYIAFSNFYIPSKQPSDRVLFIYHCFFGYIFSFSVAIFTLAVLMDTDYLKRIRRGLSHIALYPIAQLAYSLYLTHQLIIRLATIPLVTLIAPYVWPGGPEVHVIWPLLTLSITLVIGILISSILYILIEKPCMQLRKVFSAPKQ